MPSPRAYAGVGKPMHVVLSGKDERDTYYKSQRLATQVHAEGKRGEPKSREGKLIA